MGSSKKFVSITETVEALGKEGLSVSASSVRNMIGDGRVKSVKPFGKYLIPVSEIDRILSTVRGV